MHPFPDASRLSFLVGDELEHLCLGRWQIDFNFAEARLSVAGDLEHGDKLGSFRRHNTDEDRLSPILLHRLIGQKVRLIEVEPLCLTLAFERGDVLRIHTEESAYECGQIYNKDELVVVF